MSLRCEKRLLEIEDYGGETVYDLNGIFKWSMFNAPLDLDSLTYVFGSDSSNPIVKNQAGTTSAAPGSQFVELPYFNTVFPEIKTEWRIVRSPFTYTQLIHSPWGSSTIESAKTNLSMGTIKYRINRNETSVITQPTGDTAPPGSILIVTDNGYAHYFKNEVQVSTELTTGDIILALVAIIPDPTAPITQRAIPIPVIVSTSGAIQAASQSTTFGVDCTTLARTMIEWSGKCRGFDLLVIPAISDITIDPARAGLNTAMRDLMKSTMTYPTGDEEIWTHTHSMTGIDYRAVLGVNERRWIEWDTASIGSIWVNFNSSVSITGITPTYGLQAGVTE